jgi:hypothetical protein
VPLWAADERACREAEEALDEEGPWCRNCSEEALMAVVEGADRALNPAIGRSGVAVEGSGLLKRAPASSDAAPGMPAPWRDILNVIVTIGKVPGRMQGI